MGQSQNICKPVHPRACGEHQDYHTLHHNKNGSSPRVRGTSVWMDIRRTDVRFIPARAGNIMYPSGGNSKGEVHPRACGEHIKVVDFSIEWGGSSPRVRGT